MEAKQKKQNSLVIYFKNLSKKDKIILSSTIVLIAIFLGLRFLIIPQFEKYEDNLINLESKKAEQAKIKMILIQNKALEEKNEELKEKYNTALEEISKTPAVAQIIYDLKELIDINNVEVKTISFSSTDVSEDDIKSYDEVKTDEDGVVTEIDRGINNNNESQTETSEVKEEDKIQKQIINISLVGEYENIVGFIKSIENYSRIAEVSGISFGLSEGDLLSVNLTANFYNLSYKESENYDFNSGTYGKENSFD